MASTRREGEAQDGENAYSQTLHDFITCKDESRMDFYMRLGCEGIRDRKESNAEPIGMPPSTCKENCEICCQQWLSPGAQRMFGPYAGEVPDEIAQVFIATHLADIKEAHSYISSTLQTHGDIILKRWSKKTMQQRGKFLGEHATRVFFEFPRSKDPDMNCGMNRKMEELKPGLVQEAHKMLPRRYSTWKFGNYANIEDFMEDKSKLLNLLHLRATHKPEEWAAFDMKSAYQVWFFGQHPMWYNANCVKMYGDQYGELTEYDPSLAHCWAHVGFPRAFMTIQAQHELMVSLKTAVQGLVGESEATGNTKWSALARNNFAGAGSEALSEPYLNQAFHLPAMFDVEAMLQKARARLDMLLDEVWLMQSDPSYMHQILKQRKADVYYDSNAPDVNTKWAQIGLELLQELLNRMYTWQEIVEGLEETLATFKQEAQHIRPGEKFPPKTNQLFFSIRIMLRMKLTRANRLLKKVLPSMRTVKGRYTAQQVGSTIQYQNRNGLDPNNQADRVYGVLETIDALFLQEGLSNGLPLVFIMLKREMRLQGKDEYFDQRLNDHIMDLALLEELYSMCKFSQRAVYQVDPNSMTREEYEDLYSSVQRTTFDVMGNHDDSYEFEQSCVKRVGTLLRQFSETPWPKGRKDASWLKKAEICRVKLARLWNAIREETVRPVRPGEMRCSCEESTLKREKLVSSIRFDSGEAFDAQVEAERQECAKGDHLQKLKAEQAAESLLAQPQTNWDNTNGADAPKARKQTKAKASRAHETALSSKMERLHLSSEPVQGSAVSNTSRPPMSLKKDSYSTFCRLFATMDDGERGDIRWTSFLHAMEDAGLSAIEASGSAVAFCGSNGRIIFHRPHPNPVLNAIMAYNIGRRLGRRFGWSAASFVPEQKGG